MRLVCLFILVLTVGAVVVFAVQNNETVTLRFFEWNITCSLPLLVAVVYLLGTVSGWTVIGMLRRTLRRATEHRES